MATLERVLELLEYDPDTGQFTNRIDRRRAPKGVRSGSPSGHGYRKISIDSYSYYEHHLAWLYIHGEWPTEIDHIDGDRSNNAIANLRVATRSQNNMNKLKNGSEGLPGAYYNYRDCYWFSKIQVDGIVKWLGRFGSELEAHIVYVVMAEFYHGAYANSSLNSNGRN